MTLNGQNAYAVTSHQKLICYWCNVRFSNLLVVILVVVEVNLMTCNECIDGQRL